MSSGVNIPLHTREGLGLIRLRFFLIGCSGIEIQS